MSEVHEVALAKTRSRDDRSWLERVVSTLERLVTRRRAFLWIVALGLALNAVSLGIGLTADDHFHAVALRDDLVSPGMERAPWDQFAFAKGPKPNLALMEEGAFPWWTDPQLVIAFFRPLSSLTLWLDHSLWPHAAWLMHLHSMVWFVLLLGSVWCVLHTLGGAPGVAGLALLIYAVDDARSMPVGWIANRNALVALAPAFLAIAAHHRWRTGKGAAWGLLGPLCLVVGLLGGEPALPVCGYLFAYAVFLDKSGLIARMASLLPYAVVVVAWRAIYNKLGYGALHSGIYLDPGREPLAFAEELVVRLPVLLLSQFALPMSDLWEAYPLFAPSLQSVVLGLAVVVLGVFVWLLYPLLRRDAVLRFWALGAVLATVPVCGTHPEDRVLTATALGGSVLIARFVVALAKETLPHWRSVRQLTGWALLAIHLVVAPLLLPVRTLAITSMEEMMLKSDASIPSGSSTAQETVVLLNPPVDLFAVYLPAFRLARGIQGPKRLRWLATGESELRIERVDTHTVKATPKDGFLSSSSQLMFRRADRSILLDEPMRLAGVTFTVTRHLSDGRPAEVLVRFDEDPDGPEFRWLCWDKQAYKRLVLPRVGQVLTLPAVDLRQLLFD